MRGIDRSTCATPAGPAGWCCYLRVMACVSMLKGLYHWAEVCGIIGEEGGFEAPYPSWQATTVFFSVIDLVAAVGLWLVAPWGAVVWLTSTVSMIVVHVFFDQVYGTTGPGDRGRRARDRGLSGARGSRRPRASAREMPEEMRMARIGFIGLGNMGLPMAANLVKAGHAVTGFDCGRSRQSKNFRRWAAARRDRLRLPRATPMP